MAPNGGPSILPLVTTSPWVRLEAVEGLVLLCFEQTPTSYRLLVTDLVHVWQDDSCYNDIIKHAANGAECPIEVTSPDKVQFLVTTLHAGLTSGNAAIHWTVDADSARLVLSQRLPALPLSLNWKFTLTPPPSESAIIAGILVGLVSSAERLNRKIGLLTTLAGEKDYHLRSIQEELANIGGSYTPRRHKQALRAYEPSPDVTTALTTWPEVLNEVSRGLDATGPVWPSVDLPRESHKSTEADSQASVGPSLLAESSGTEPEFLPPQVDPGSAEVHSPDTQSPEPDELARKRQRAVEQTQRVRNKVKRSRF